MNKQHQDPELIVAVEGTWAGDELQHLFQREVADLLQRNKPDKFPGAQPVSFAKQHLHELKQQDYYVCEKTDGLRALMYMTHDGPNPAVYLVDRRNDYYWVKDLFFPALEHANYTKHHKETILDGELVIDNLPGGSKRVKYLAFDCLMVDKKDLRERTLDKRLAYLKDWILKPYNQWLQSIAPQAREEQKLIVELKSNQFSYALPMMFHEIIPKVKQLHGNDGLIFTCRGSSYVSGTDQHILKWKPPNENTVDFLMHIKWSTTDPDPRDPDPRDPDQSRQEDYWEIPEAIELYIFHGRSMDYSYVGDLYLTRTEWEDMKNMNVALQNAIVECYQEDLSDLNGQTDGSSPQRRWRYYRMRDDKDEANHVSVFESVRESIEDHVTEKDLLDHAEQIRAAWKARDARRQSRPQ